MQEEGIPLKKAVVIHTSITYVRDEGIYPGHMLKLQDVIRKKNKNRKA